MLRIMLKGFSFCTGSCAASAESAARFISHASLYSLSVLSQRYERRLSVGAAVVAALVSYARRPAAVAFGMPHHVS